MSKSKEFTVKIRGGTLIITEEKVKDFPGVSVCFQPKESDDIIDLVVVRQNQSKPEKKDDPYNIDIYVWDDVYTEDWNLHTVVSGREAAEALS